jgi:putative nucleotidyltransferase with HDIG domain
MPHRAFFGSPRRRVAGLAGGRFTIAGLTALLATAVYALSSADRSLADAPAPLFLLVVPLAMASIAYGLKGGVLSGVVAASLAFAWWLQHGELGGIAWVLTRGVTCLLVGGLLGRLADSRHALSREILQQRELSLERLERTVAERTRQLEEARQETVARLALAAEYHDDETQQHTRRVGETAARIAARLGLDEHDVDLIREAALLHDVGKVGIPEAVLLKQGTLTQLELVQVRKHAEIGARILSESTSEVLIAAEEIARSHHERWDGTGYPQGLEGETIPLFARIVAVADVFDAITQARPYKAARPVSEAVEEIHTLSGAHFDPAVVAAFDGLDAHQLAGLPQPRTDLSRRPSERAAQARSAHRAA